MKRILTLAASILMTASVWAQSPEKMSYQAVIRDENGILINSTSVGIQISILQGSVSGTAVYVETQTPTSNANGLITLEIGTGTTSDDFSNIDWTKGTYFIKIEIDPVGGTSYTITSTSQLLSVPYALHAKTAENVANDQVDDADADPSNELQNLSVSVTGDTLYLQNGGFVIIPGISLANPLEIGDIYQGGIVFYIFQPGDAGYVKDEVHGLIASPSDQSSAIEWGCMGTNIGSTTLTIGTGTQNTNVINNVCTEVGIAADTCINLTLGGYNDWFLPSYYELNLMYQNIGKGNALGLGNIGGFSDVHYWSSSEAHLNAAWTCYFSTGSFFPSSKNSNYSVRAVRTF